MLNIVALTVHKTEKRYAMKITKHSTFNLQRMLFAQLDAASLIVERQQQHNEHIRAAVPTTDTL